MPFHLLTNWLEEEKIAGAPNPQQAILSTTTLDAIPHSRVVAIREVTEDGLLFFTQQGTRKVDELQNNPRVSITFWFELKQREVIVEGLASALSDQENACYWHSYPREAQIRFAAYAPTSMQPISSKKILEDKKLAIITEFSDKNLPVNPFYCGFRIQPLRFVFYAYRTDELSDVTEYFLQDAQWHKQLLSP